MAIALTGGIAEGKSTVLGIAAGHGISTASADAVVADLWNDERFRHDIATLLGLEPPTTREAVRALVTADADARARLNAATHTDVMTRLLESDAQLIEIPLLIEAVAHPLFHRVWVVTCGATEQERRLQERLGDAEAVRRFLATQLPTRVKMAFADRILRTDEPLSSVLDTTVEALVEDGLLFRQS